MFIIEEIFPVVEGGKNALREKCLSSCSKQTYSHLTNIEVNELRRIMSHKATEVPTYEAVPSASRF